MREKERCAHYPLSLAYVRFTDPLPARDNIIIGRRAQYARVLFATIDQRARVRAPARKRGKRINKSDKNYERQMDSRLKAKEGGWRSETMDCSVRHETRARESDGKAGRGGERETEKKRAGVGGKEGEGEKERETDRYTCTHTQKEHDTKFIYVVTAED